MAEVAWSGRAITELEAIAEYIHELSPLAAQRVAVRLTAAAEALDLYPLRGRSISGDRRELTQVSPYLIRYRVEDDQMLILEVRHGAREPDDS